MLTERYFFVLDVNNEHGYDQFLASKISETSRGKEVEMFGDQNRSEIDENFETFDFFSGLFADRWIKWICICFVFLLILLNCLLLYSVTW
jgi:hypothetical protein